MLLVDLRATERLVQRAKDDLAIIEIDLPQGVDRRTAEPDDWRPEVSIGKFAPWTIMDAALHGLESATEKITDLEWKIRVFMDSFVTDN